MTLTVNGEPVEVRPGETVAALLARMRLDRAPCAVEVNRTLVPKARHPERELAEGDVVEVVTLVGGG